MPAPGDGRQGSAIRSPRPAPSPGRVTDTRPVSTTGHGSLCRVNPRPLLPNVSEAGGGQASRHRALPCAIHARVERRQGCIGPPVSAASACSACLAADPKAGHIHSSRCRTTGLPEGKRRRTHSRRRCASWMDQWRIPIVRTKGSERPSRSDRPSLIAETMVVPSPGRWWCHRRDDGGARRDRTDDLMLAKHALSRLSYCPFRRQ